MQLRYFPRFSTYIQTSFDTESLSENVNYRLSGQMHLFWFKWRVRGKNNHLRACWSLALPLRASQDRSQRERERVIEREGAGGRSISRRGLQNGWSAPRICCWGMTRSLRTLGRSWKVTERQPALTSSCNACAQCLHGLMHRIWFDLRTKKQRWGKLGVVCEALCVFIDTSYWLLTSFHWGFFILLGLERKDRKERHLELQ